MRNKITYYIDNSLIENRDHLVNSNVGQRLFPMKWIYCTFDKINIRLLLMPNFSFRRWWMFKLNFAKTIWWWQSGCKDGWTPDSISKIVWDTNIFIIPIARLTQWAADVIWTSNGRLYDVRPSIENMVRLEDVQIVSIMDVH